MEGWDSYYYGAECPARDFVEQIKDKEPHIIAISTTLLYHVNEVEKLVQMIREDGEIEKPKILVGGYAFKIS